MKYQFKYRNTAFDLWQLSMYYTYGSIVGVCNVIFTAAMILLALKFWQEAGTAARLFLLLACILFPVIQPAGVYMQARKRARAVKEDTEIGFDDSGIHIKSGAQDSGLSWNTIKRVSKKPNMIVIFSNTTHGFVLNNRVLGKQREAFYRYVVSRMNKLR